MSGDIAFIVAAVGARGHEVRQIAYRHAHANDAHLDVNLKFKINDSYRNKNDKTKLLFGSPGSKEKPMLEMDPKMAKAKGADGFYTLRVGGTLGKPDVRAGTPSGGAATEPTK